MHTVEFETHYDEGEVTQVETVQLRRRGDSFIVARLGNFHGLSDAAIVMLAQMEDGI